MLLNLLIVFAAAKALGEIAERLGQPAIVGEILAGVLIGPSILGWVHGDETLSSLAELGVLFLLFRVGLEVKSSELIKIGGTAALVAVLGVVLPFGTGALVMWLWHVSGIESFFVGASLVATSVGVTARVLAAKGLLHQRASKVILAAAVIDDILGLLVLAVVSSLAKGTVNVAALAVTATLAIGFTFVVAKFGTPALQFLIPRVERRLATSEAQFTLAMVLLLGLSVLSNRIGVAAIVGAFLAGMALSETVDTRVHDLAQGVTELLVPFFLVGIGLQLDITVFRNGNVLLLCGIVTAIAVLTKLIGCGLGAWGLGRVDMQRVGVGMIPRGEVGMVVAQIGLRLGVITKPVYAVVVFMTVATTLIAPPLLNYAYRHCEREAPEEQFSWS